jgi:hypothetical protein
VLAAIGFVGLVSSAPDVAMAGSALVFVWCAALSLAFFGSARSQIVVDSEEVTVRNWWRERRVPVLGARVTTTSWFPGLRLGRIVAADGTVLRPNCLYARWLGGAQLRGAIDHVNGLIAERSSRGPAQEGRPDGDPPTFRPGG